MAPDPRSRSSSRLAPWAAALAVLLCGAVWAGGLRGPFLLDDAAAIVESENIESLTPLARALDAPDGTGADARPLVALSLALNYALGGRAVFGYRLFDLGVHLATALALLGLARRILIAAPGAHAEPVRASVRVVPVLGAAALACAWVVHPIHSATLHHVIQRNGTMMALFYLLALYGAVRGFASARPGPWFAASVLACWLGATCKEEIASAPLVVLLYDRAFVSGSLRSALRRHAGLYAGLALTWLLLAGLATTGGRSASVGFWIESCTPLDYLRTQAKALLLYARLALWPDRLAFDYGGFPIAHRFADVRLEGSLVVLLLALSLAGLWRKRPWGWVASGVFLVLAPTSSFIPLTGAVVAEHRMYLPLAGLLALLGMALVRATSASPRLAPHAGAIVVAAAALAVVPLGATTWRRNLVFRSELAVWEDTVRKRPENGRAWGYYAIELKKAGRAAEAERAYRAALALAPRFYVGTVNLAHILFERGELEEAESLYARAAELHPTDGEPRYYLGAIGLATGKIEQGTRELRAALERSLDERLRGPALRELAWVLATSPDESVRDGEEALRLARELAAAGPARARRLDVLAAALAEVGRFEEAVETARRAIEAARAAGSTALLPGLEAHRAAFERGERWRERRDG